MDNYLKAIIISVFLLALSLSMIVYFGFFYSFEDASLSPEVNESSNRSVEVGDAEIYREKNETNESGYWVEGLPNSGGTYSITPLIIYEKLGKTKSFAWAGLIVAIIAAYIYYKIRSRKKIEGSLTNRFT